MIYTNPNVRESNRAGYVIASFICDEVSELPSVNYIQDYTLDMGSTAHVIGVGDYEMKSTGVWVLREPTVRVFDAYTKSEVDGFVSALDDRVDAVEEEMSNQLDWMRDIIDGKGKNLLNVFDAYSGQTTTINGVTWTVNNDGTVTANGTATANSFFYVTPSNSNIVFSSYRTIMTGCPAGGSDSTYEMQTVQIGGATHHDYGSGVEQVSGYSYRYVVLTVRNGYTANNLVFKPMICLKDVYDITSEFVSYTPPMSELYQLIRGYHS